MHTLKLIRPTQEYADQVMAYRQEMLDNGDSLDGCAALEDTNSYAEDLDIDSAASTVAPTKGALALANFKTRVGSRALITLTRSAGPVPFGATASIVGDKDNSSIVGDGGQVYLSGVAQSGELDVKWGNDASQQCHASFTLPADNNQNSGIKMVTARCE